MLLVASPAVFVALAASLLYADLRIRSAETVTTSVQPGLQLSMFGVYISPEDQKSLAALSDSTSQSPTGPWQLRAAVAEQNMAIEYSFGSLAPPSLGGKWELIPARLSGSLKKSTEIVFMVPTGTDFYKPAKQPSLLAAMPNDPSSACAEWTAGGQSHSVRPRILDGGGAPDLAVCKIPPIPETKDLAIKIFATVHAPTLHSSFYGESRISVLNQATAFVTMHQSSELPPGIEYSSGRPLDLHLQISGNRSFDQMFPDPASGTIDSREWIMQPGGEVVVNLADTSRHNLVDVTEQFVLILAGIFFGLLPTAIGSAHKAKRKGPVDSPRSGTPTSP